MGEGRIRYRNIRSEYQSGRIHVSHQKEAVIFSFEEERRVPLEEAKKQTVSLITGLQKQTEQEGGMIGHIKAYVEEVVSGYALSGIEGIVSEEKTDSRKARIYFTAILFSVNEKEICQFLNKWLA